MLVGAVEVQSILQHMVVHWGMGQWDTVGEEVVPGHTGVARLDMGQ